MGHFTRANVEEFVRNNATAWGTQEIVIRMTWGYWEPLVATVVPLEIHGNSQIGVHHQASVDGTNRPTLVRKSSPPLGIPLAAMDDMQADYHFLLQGIVRDNLSKYVSIAYDDQDSDLPERLLTSIGTFFRESKDAGDEVLQHQFHPANATDVLQLDRTSQTSPRNPRRVHNPRTKPHPR